MTRPHRTVVVTGIGTEVGKTWVTVRLVTELRRLGYTVAARKPAQSFLAGATGEPAEATDAELLARASGEPVEVVCPPHRWYPVALAPPMAAEALGWTVPAVADLASEVELAWPPTSVDVGLVEGAGGVASPLASDGDTVALVRALRADVAVVVGDPALGVISALRLAVRALDPTVVIAHLNRFDPGDDLHLRNLSWLESRDRMRVTTTVAALGQAVLSA